MLISDLYLVYSCLDSIVNNNHVDNKFKEILVYDYFGIL